LLDLSLPKATAPFKSVNDIVSTWPVLVDNLVTTDDVAPAGVYSAGILDPTALAATAACWHFSVTYLLLSPTMAFPMRKRQP
jgi:hypothetical protein